jgi:pimeloyl-ACP methyl ester carboxylesterase
MVLVHGAAGHSRWWDHLAPLLAADRRVVALDLSGHGDSDRRDEYGLPQWTREVLAVADASGISGRPVVIGHSMGGFVALDAATRVGSDLAGVVVIDSPVTDPQHLARASRTPAPAQVVASREQSIARFRAVPHRGPTLPFVVAHIAEHSVRRVDAGWTWKFDHRIFGRVGDSAELYRAAVAEVVVIRPERGLITPAMADRVLELTGGSAAILEIADAGHHVLLDQPQALVAGIDSALDLLPAEGSLSPLRRD